MLTAPRRRGWAFAILVSAWLASGASWAQAPAETPTESPAPSPAPSPAEPPAEPPAEAAPADEAQPQEGPDPAALERAKKLFKEGNALRKAGDCQGAVVKYALSREEVPVKANTKNAAVCLRELGRLDEALEMYEELLTKFGDALSDEDRQIVSAGINELRAEVGAVDVVANVAGTLVIDGRARGELPLSLPVRVMPGSHRVVVLRPGYKSFEKTVAVKARQTVAVDATLEALADSGEVKIDDPTLEGARVYVDGAPLGVVPWRGSLEPGQHRFFVRRDNLGSAPKLLEVVKGQTIKATAKLEALGADLRIEADPTTASLAIDGVPVGAGRWQGRLPLGRYEITAAEEGYVTGKQSLDVKARTDRAALKLEIDEDHPRWEVAIPGGPWVEVFGGGLFAPSLNGLFEGSECDLFDDCTGDAFASGFIVMGRGGYEFPMGLSVMAGGGYLGLFRTVNAPVGIDGVSQSQQLQVRGPFGVVGLRQRFVFAEMFETRLAYSFGLMGMSSQADITIFDEEFGDRSGVSEGGGFNIFLMPEIQFGMRFGGFGLALGFATPLFLLPDPAEPQDAEFTGGGIYKNFFAFLPSLSASYLF